MEVAEWAANSGATCLHLTTRREPDAPSRPRPLSPGGRARRISRCRTLQRQLSLWIGKWILRQLSEAQILIRDAGKPAGHPKSRMSQQRQRGKKGCTELRYEHFYQLQLALLRRCQVERDWLDSIACQHLQQPLQLFAHRQLEHISTSPLTQV